MCRLRAHARFLFNIRGGEDLSLFEVNEAAEIIRANTHPESNIIFGAVIDPNMKGEIQLTVIATGFDKPRTVEPPVSSYNQRSYEPRTTAPRVEQPKINPDYTVRTFDREDLDIPAFLRRTRSNGR